MADVTWLADVLRNAGLKVVEEENWKKRGRGDMGEIQGILLHHTAGPKPGDYPSRDTVKWGRPGLKGPLAHLGLSNDGTYYVTAAGVTNHAGKGSWKGITSGNKNLIGIEAENTGLDNDPWVEVQYDAYVNGVAAILEHLGLPTDRAIAHKEWAPKRKIDPSFDMKDFREKVDMARKRMRKLKEAGEKLEEVTEKAKEEVKVVVQEAPVVAITQNPKAHQAKKMLEDMGWKDYQAAALIAQAMVESGESLDPEAAVYTVNKVPVTRETPGAEITAYGIMKWRGGRLDHLKTFSGKINDLEEQVRFIDWELRNTEKVAAKKIKDSTEIMEALRGAIGYVRPANWSVDTPENGAGWKDRVIFAYQLLNK